MGSSFSSTGSFSSLPSSSSSSSSSSREGRASRLLLQWSVVSAIEIMKFGLLVVIVNTCRSPMTNRRATTSVGQILQQNNSVCEVATLIPFTDSRDGPPSTASDPNAHYYGYGSWPNQSTLNEAAFSLMVASEMAKIHFNNRDTSIVTQLADLTQGCNITIPTAFAINTRGDDGNMQYYDSSYSRTTSTDLVVDLFRDYVKAGLDPTKSLCAIVGPVEKYAVEGVSVLTEPNGNVPQIGYASIDPSLDDDNLFRTFVRLIPASQHLSRSVIKFVQRPGMWRYYIAMVYSQGDFGEQFKDAMQPFEDRYNVTALSEGFVQGDDNSIRSALGRVVWSGYRTIIFAADREADLADVARIAEEEKLLGEGFFWIVSGYALSPEILPTLRYEVDSPVDKLLRGAAVFTNYDPFVYNGENDPFLMAWRDMQNSNISEELIGHLKEIQPPSSQYDADASSYFETATPSEYSSFLYDSIMATGISACQVADSNTSKNSPGEAHRQAMLQVNFTGASGPVMLAYDDESGEHTNGRNPSGVVFGMYNIRAGVVDASGKRSYEAVLTHSYSHENSYYSKNGTFLEYGAWQSVPSTEFIYFDGTTEEPSPLQTVSDFNYLNKNIQGLGFFLVGLSLFISVATAGWVYWHRKERQITISQPEFLYLLCLGACFVATSLIFISFDEDKGWSKQQLDFGCSAFLWFFIIGYLVIYCALYCKLWRLNKLLQMRRRVVTVRQVLVPFAVVIACSVLLLLFWEIFDPPVWEREVTNDYPLETIGSCGLEKQHFLRYITPLAALFATVTVMTAVVAWKLKDVQTDLSESRWIFFGIMCHLQTWAMGVPILVITDDVSVEASYIMKAALTFVFSTSMVLLVIWPKIFVWFRDSYLSGPAGPMPVLTGGGTRVTGVTCSDQDPTVSFADPDLVTKLQKEVASLKQRLEGRENKACHPD